MKQLFFLLCFIFFPLCASAWDLVGSGVSLTAPSGISDDFSTDRITSDYITTVGGITVSGGVAVGSTNYSDNSAIFKTSTGSDTHYAQLDLQFVLNAYPGVLVGASGASTSATGYSIVFISATRISLYSFNNGVGTDTGKYWSISDMLPGTYYTTKVVKNGTSFELWVNGSHILPDITDSTYTGGQYIGISASRFSGYSATIDNFTGGGL